MSSHLYDIRGTALEHASEVTRQNNVVTGSLGLSVDFTEESSMVVDLLSRGEGKSLPSSCGVVLGEVCFRTIGTLTIFGSSDLIACKLNLEENDITGDGESFGDAIEDDSMESGELIDCGDLIDGDLSGGDFSDGAFSDDDFIDGDFIDGDFIDCGDLIESGEFIDCCDIASGESNDSDCDICGLGVPFSISNILNSSTMNGTIHFSSGKSNLKSSISIK